MGLEKHEKYNLAEDTEASNIESREKDIEGIDEFVEEEKGFLNKFTKGKVGKIARGLALLTTIAVSNVACSSEKEDTQSFEDGTNIENVGSDKGEKTIDSAANNVLDILAGLKQASVRRGSMSEQMVKEDVLSSYFSIVESIKNTDGTSLSDEEIKNIAYQNLKESLNRLADTAGNEDGELDEEEKEWLDKVKDSKPGIKILSNILEDNADTGDNATLEGPDVGPETFGDGGVEDEEVEEETKNTKEGHSNESTKVDTSAY